MARVYVAVGSNLGDREKNFSRAKELVEKIKRTKFLRASAIYETDPVGGPPQGKYLNAVWEMETDLAPKKFLRNLLEVERQMGRVRSQRNAPRGIDLDLLFHEDKIIKSNQLTIPHPRLHERIFVLQPLAELAPDFMHPVLKKTIRELYLLCHPRMGLGGDLTR